MDLLISVSLYLSGFSLLIVSRHIQCCLRCRDEVLRTYKEANMRAQRVAYLRANA